VARRQNLPQILPFLSDSNVRDRDSLIKAIEVIEKENDRLTIYSHLRQKLLPKASEEKLFQGIQFE
jgi:hypothetical protein